MDATKHLVVTVGSNPLPVVVAILALAPCWSGLGSKGQLSSAIGMPSPSSSWLSHASPLPSPSPSRWSGLGCSQQLSSPSFTPSPSESSSR